jgi:hypothetical protein
MRRIHQRTWFCLAAAWLAVSLAMSWRHDIDLAPRDLRQTHEEPAGKIIRRLQDLDVAHSHPQQPSARVESLTSPGTPTFTVIQEKLKTGESVLNPVPELPVETSKMSAVPERDVSLDVPAVERAAYQQPIPGKMTSPVWLDSRIEICE